MLRLLLVFGVLLFMNTSVSSQMAKKTIAQRTLQAAKIFEGKVIKKTSFWNTQRTRIFTANEIAVSRSFKGDVPEIIEVVTHGGNIDGVEHQFMHGIHLPIGSEGVFFCKYFKNSPHSSDRFLMFNGQSGFLRYDMTRNDYQATDGFAGYKNLQKEVFDFIVQTTKVEPLIYGQNCYEKAIETWLNTNQSIFVSTDTIIEFTFDNVQIVGTDEVEFDIFARSNSIGIKFAATDIFLQYSTEAFGSNAVQNDKIEASKETVIQNDVYSLDLTDEADNIVKIIVGSTAEPTALYPISQTAEKFLHIKIGIADVYQLATISFNTFLMGNNSMFYDETTDTYVGFDKIVVSPPISPFGGPMIMDFFGTNAAEPHHITAGTGEILTIIGSGFGTAKGTVQFNNADTFLGTVETSPNDIESWMETEIQVRVPSADADFSGHTASSGTFMVVLPSGGGSVQTTVPVIVDYSVHNFRTGEFNSVPIYFGDSEAGDGNDNGQLVFTLSTNMNDNAGARAIIERSLCDWNAQTEVNWELSVTPSTNTTAADNDMVNLIYFGGENEFMGDLSELGAYTILILNDNRRINCNPDGVFQREVDIVFREGNNLSNTDPNITGWHFTSLATPTNASSTEADFYSYALHELGHAHMLRHVQEAPKIMNVPEGAGYNNRGFTDEDEAGGEFVLTSSQTAFTAAIFCPSGVIPVNTAALCGTNSTANLSNQNAPIKYQLNGEELILIFPEDGYAGKYAFDLFTMDGKKIYHTEFDLSNGQIQITISLQSLDNSGFFIFSIMNQDTQKHFSGKLVLAR